MAQEIKTEIYTLITDDAIFQTLTGATADDKRLYVQFPPDEIDETNPWVTYFTVTGGKDADEIGSQQDPDITFIFDIWGLDHDAIEDVFDRLKTLMDQQGFSTASFRVVFTRLETVNDLAEIRENLSTIYHKNIRFRMRWVMQR